MPTKHIQVQFQLIDHFNPGFGYSLTIENAVTGTTILFVSKAPDTGNDLLTPADCLRVAAMYC